MYSVITGDLVGSRKIHGRTEVQLRLIRAIESLNLGLSPIPPIALTAGDEVQALLTRHEDCVRVIVEISDAVYPARMSFGIGFGEISTLPVDPVDHVDGPAFHRARSALEHAQKQGVLGCAEGFGAGTDALLSGFLGLMGAVRWSWTAKQAVYVRDSRKMAQKEVAASYNVVPSVVSESLKAAHFKETTGAEEALYTFLSEFGINTDFAAGSVHNPNQ